jgi:hypothetical protein
MKERHGFVAHLFRNQVVFGFMEGRGMMEKINMQRRIGL